jgi:hypothetical protein
VKKYLLIPLAEKEQSNESAFADNQFEQKHFLEK